MQQQKVSSLFQGGALLPVGIKAEQRAVHFLSQQPGLLKIDDVREQKAWQDKEIDFRAHFPTRIVDIEVKSDRHVFFTQNFLFELARVHHTSRNHCAYLGWSVFSEAQRFLVYCPDKDLFYSFDTRTLRQEMQMHVKEKGKKTRVDVVPSDENRTTFNILIPLSDLTYNLYACENQKWRLQL